jgi:hypothetical protein
MYTRLGAAPSHADMDALVDHLNKTNDLSAQKSALPSLASIHVPAEDAPSSSSEAEAEAKAEMNEGAIATARYWNQAVGKHARHANFGYSS